MNFNETELNTIRTEAESFLKSVRPGRAALDKPDIIFHIDEQTVEFCLLRPAWQSAIEKKNIHPFARITRQHTRGVWVLSMLSVCNTWEYYNDCLSLNDALEAITADRLSYFLD